MAKNVRIEWHEDESGVFLDGTSGQLGAMIQKSAEDVADVARTLAGTFRKSGEYQSSIHTEAHRGKIRSGWRIVAEVPYAAKIESKYGTLKKALNSQAN